MTLGFSRSSAIINLTRLKTVHYGMHLISCQMSCVDDALPLSVLCKPRRMLVSETKWSQNEICHAGKLRYTLFNSAGKNIANGGVLGLI